MAVNTVVEYWGVCDICGATNSRSRNEYDHAEEDGDEMTAAHPEYCDG